MTLNVNLFGGPGTGKSTMMAALFAELKMDGCNVEMSHEFAKKKVWEESFGVLDDQYYIFGKQYHGLHILQDKVDAVITDSPLLLSLIYAKDKIAENCWDAFEELVVTSSGNMDNLNIFLMREKEYNPAGRMQNEGEAKEIDKRLMGMLDTYGIKYGMVASNKNGIATIRGMIYDYF